MRGHVREDAEEEFSLSARLKGCGYDDVAPLCQVDPLEHGPGVDVDAPTDLLLGDVHAVDPVQLHLNTALFNVNVRLTADSATSHTLYTNCNNALFKISDYIAATETAINVEILYLREKNYEDYYFFFKLRQCFSNIFRARTTKPINKHSQPT